MGTIDLPVDDDLALLSRVIDFISRFLFWLLNQDYLFAYVEDLRLLREAYNESVAGPVESILAQLQEPTAQQRDRLALCGLSGASLRMKVGLLFADVTRGRIKRLIARINSILGSLSSVFPGADAIKEFKDQTEASMGDLEDTEGPQPLDI